LQHNRANGRLTLYAKLTRGIRKIVIVYAFPYVYGGQKTRQIYLCQ
jgi:hypothetical protein